MIFSILYSTPEGEPIGWSECKFEVFDEAIGHAQRLRMPVTVFRRRREGDVPVATWTVTEGTRVLDRSLLSRD